MALFSGLASRLRSSLANGLTLAGCRRPIVPSHSFHSCSGSNHNNASDSLLSSYRTRWNSNRLTSATSQLMPVIGGPQVQQNRSIIKYNWEHGERETNMEVVKRFTRLHWGIWIRPRAANKKYYRKCGKKRWTLKQFVFTNATQSAMLEKMVTTYHRVRRYYPNDPLRPYHSRQNFPIMGTKPQPCKELQHPWVTSKKELEDNWYKSMNLIPETQYKRPMHKKLK